MTDHNDADILVIRGPLSPLSLSGDLPVGFMKIYQNQWTRTVSITGLIDPSAYVLAAGKGVRLIRLSDRWLALDQWDEDTQPEERDSLIITAGGPPGHAIVSKAPAAD